MNKWLEKFIYHPIFKELKISKITLDDKDLYNKFIKESEFPANVWSGNFSYIWSYNNSNRLSIFKFILDNMLVTIILTNQGRLYLPTLPFGRGNAEYLLKVLIKCGVIIKGWNKYSNYYTKSIVNPINKPQLTFLQSHKLYSEYFHTEPLSGKERHYSLYNLINLPGSEFSRLRHKINKFNRTYPVIVVRRYEDKDYQQVIDLGKLWEENSGKKYRRIIDNFYFKPIIKNYRELDHIIIVIELNGKIIGISTGEILPTGEAWGCITKFNKDYNGLSVKLAIEMAKEIYNINPNVSTINTGGDLGDAGLAFYKDQLRPIYRFERYALFFDDK